MPLTAHVSSWAQVPLLPLTFSPLILAPLPLPFTLLCKTYFLPNPYLCVLYCLLSENISTFKGVLWSSWHSLLLNGQLRVHPYLWPSPHFSQFDAVVVELSPQKDMLNPQYLKV